ncbi:TPA: hypothetical protein DDW35_05960 [Candidatus Sumerlaeota bacterium]|jgi:uncharacterized protein involved in exopolysaccharide biosynthesis|nr:hypothetical protein [Candidatus Sumerlaeota bacterium]
MPIQANQMSVHEILEMIFQNKWLFLFCTAFGLLISIGYISRTEKWYSSRADIQVVDRNSSEPLLRGLGVTTSVAARFNAVRARILSPNNMEKFVAEIQTENKESLRKNVNETNRLPNLGDLKKDVAAKILSSSIGLGVANGIIFVTAECHSPHEAQFIVDRLQARVRDELMNTREDRLRDAQSVLKGLLDEYSDKLKKSEEFLRDFEVYNQVELFEGREQTLEQSIKLQNAMPGGATGGATSLVGRSTALSEKTSENEIKLKTLQTRLKATQEQIKKEPEFSVSSYTSEPSATNKQMESLVAKSEAELALLRQNRTSEHPLVQEKEAEVRELRAKQAQLSTPVIRQEQKVANPVLAQLKMQEANLRTEIDAMEQEQIVLIKQIKELHERIKTIPGKELEKTRIKRELTILTSTYQNIRQRFEDATLTGKIENEDRQTFSTLTPATFDASPTKPKKEFIYIMGLFLGMTVGVVLCFLREFTDTTFRNLEDASRFLDLPILGVIPEVSGPQSKRPSHRRGHAV